MIINNKIKMILVNNKFIIKSNTDYIKNGVTLQYLYAYNITYKKELVLNDLTVNNLIKELNKLANEINNVKENDKFYFGDLKYKLTHENKINYIFNEEDTMEFFKEFKKDINNLIEDIKKEFFEVDEFIDYVLFI
jgi:predicted DNA-binding transcriptional regulator